ncbi:MAG: hypothetical protein QXG38_02490 [Candidatus Hadarchaeales archaeon]
MTFILSGPLIFLILLLAASGLIIAAAILQRKKKQETCKFCKKIWEKGRIEIGKSEKPKSYIICPDCAKKLISSVKEVEAKNRVCRHCNSKSAPLWEISSLGLFCPTCTPEIMRKLEEVTKAGEF